MGTSLSTGQIPPDDNCGAGILAVAWVETALGLLTLTACVYARCRIGRHLALENVFLCFAALLALTCSTFVTIQVHFGFGRHYQFLTPSNAQKALEMVWLAQPFSLMSITCGKISASLLLMRVVRPKENKASKSLLWFILISFFCVNTSLIPVAFVQCSPTSYLWTQYSPGSQGSCWDADIVLNFASFQSAYSAFTDLVLAVFPVFLIRDSKISPLARAGVYTIVICGLLSTTSAALKTWQLQVVLRRDFSAVQVPFTYCYLSETWLIIIATSLPGLGQLYHRNRLGSESTQQHLSVSEASDDRYKADDDLEECKSMQDDGDISHDVGLGRPSMTALRPDGCETRTVTDSATASVCDLRTLMSGEGLGHNQILKTTTISVS